ncbi:anhydro-N-acetylmuramic acid kinase [Serinicoccus chungangensis]|uniref:Anhydro-N-acetylmuramic acid kinase n=1 Tax=Serinicoccus chungangensis TaxID=767452 RepID=A0A0W8I545_9MICO|nr:anhydro-N-acetylmuramic acid kinase [Serinicoccus chungangensis]KUG53364.1 anhydro-N-acetylmuramic acid kinase [Serinicoccus chungangensis]
MIVVGVGSGTSVDGIDVAALDLDLDGEVVRALLLGAGTVPFDPDLRADVLAAFPPGRLGMQDVCRLDTRLGQAFADAVATLGAELAGGTPDLVSSHGQTLFHDVVDGQVRGTLQLGQPAWIAERTGAPVVADLRVADVAAGGQGAPLASTWDALWLGGRGHTCAALNLGGIANVTVVPGAGAPTTAVRAFDTGPANALVDAVVARESGGRLTYDQDGAGAAAGRVDDELLALLLADDYYAQAPPKTTGKERFHLGHVDAALTTLAREVPHVDLLATLTALTVRTVADALAPFAPGEVVVSGGGARNGTLLRGLTGALPDARVSTSEAHGIPVDAKEACLFALLGFLTWHGLPGTVAGVTGARHARLAGRITPGHGALRLPEPAPTAPTRLEVVA